VTESCAGIEVETISHRVMWLARRRALLWASLLAIVLFVVVFQVVPARVDDGAF
jgi:hypothetical protein